MKEKPIIFSTPMVRAILEDRKTQTRRIVKPQPKYCQLLRNNILETSIDGGFDNDIKHIKAPYQKDQILWVRETWSEFQGVNIYKADYTDSEINTIKQAGNIWEPSIFMPRKAARIFLKVTNVRVERLQDITEEDAKKEGIIFIDYGKDKYNQQKCGYNIKSEAIKGPDYCLSSAKWGFANLWDSINKKRGYGWNKNPFVWVIDFERLNGSN